MGLRSRARRVCSERRETLQAKGAGRNLGLLWRTPDIAELQFARGEAVAHLLELEPNFRITEWATRTRLSKLQIFIDGLRKAGVIVGNSIRLASEVESGDALG